jgi:CRP-like cAMP-binding protein
MMLVGAFSYGYIIGAVGNVIAQANEKKNKFYTLMGELNVFLDEGRLSPSLRVRLREYFKFKMSSSHVEAHTSLLKQMSPALRAEITLSTNTWIKRVKFFQKCPEALVIQLTLSIKQQTYPPQEKILVPGDWCDRMFIVRKGVTICRQKIITTGQLFCEESLYKEGQVAYGAHAVTFCDLYTIERDVLLTALKHFPEMKSHFKRLSLRRTFFDEIMAYTKAYRALKEDGASARLDSEMDERPAFYLEKLRIEYGDDGAGLGLEGIKLQSRKIRAATTLQRLFRGHKSRRVVNIQAAEAGTYPVFPAQMRINDAAGYSARAVDLLHHRVGTGLYSLHEKVDRLLGVRDSTPAPKWFAEQGKSGFQFCTPFDSNGKRVRHAPVPVSAKSLRTETTPGLVRFGSSAVGGGDDGGARDGELPSGSPSTSTEALASLRGGADRGVPESGGGFATPRPGSADEGSLTVRTAQLQSLVGDLAQQVSAVSRAVSDMSAAQRTFQERSQRTILAHLEHAQARIADQVVRAVAAAGGDGARLSAGTRPSALASGSGLGTSEADPPPGYAGNSGYAGYGRPPGGGPSHDHDRDQRREPHRDDWYARAPSAQRTSSNGNPPPVSRRQAYR